MLPHDLKKRARDWLADRPGYAAHGTCPTTLCPETRTDVETWCRSGVIGFLNDNQVKRLADEVTTDAHELGLRYGDDWGPMIDCMSETEFALYCGDALGDS